MRRKRQWKWIELMAVMLSTTDENNTDDNVAGCLNNRYYVQPQHGTSRIILFTLLQLSIKTNNQNEMWRLDCTNIWVTECLLSYRLIGLLIWLRGANEWMIDILCYRDWVTKNQGGQHPDFSLRSQTFCYTADFSATLLYMLKTNTSFAHPITKPPASTLEFKNFDSKRFLWLQTKTGNIAPTRLAPPAPGRPMACGNAYVKHCAKFPDLFETQC